MPSEKTQLLRKARKERPGELSSVSEKKQQGIPTAPADVPSPNLHEAPHGRDFYSSLTLSGSERSHQPSLQPSPTLAWLHALGIQEALLHVKKPDQVPAPWKSLFLLNGCRQSPLTDSRQSHPLTILHGFLVPLLPQQHNTQDPLVCWHRTKLKISSLQLASVCITGIAGACLNFGLHSHHQCGGIELVTGFGWEHN